MKPIHPFNTLYLLLLPPMSIAHIPLLMFRIGANHLEPSFASVQFIQKSMAHTSWNNHQITFSDSWLVAFRIMFTTKTQTCGPRDYPEYLMRCGVKVRITEHAIYPLWFDFPDAIEMALELRRRRIECFMVDQERLGLDRSVGNSFPAGDLTRGHLDFRGGSKHCWLSIEERGVVV